MSTHFDEFDWESFWWDSHQSKRDVQEPAPSSDIIRFVEDQLGYRLPRAYIELASVHNGGYVLRGAHAIPAAANNPDRYALIDRIASIGRTKEYSLCGSMGSKFWQTEWGYPDIGVYFGIDDGHETVCLDYRECGLNGEPSVALVEQEYDYRITTLATNFEAYIKGLQYLEDFINDS